MLQSHLVGSDVIRISMADTRQREQLQCKTHFCSVSAFRPACLASLRRKLVENSFKTSSFVLKNDHGMSMECHCKVIRPPQSAEAQACSYGG